MTFASALGIAVWLVGVPTVAALLNSRPTLLRPFVAIMVFMTCHIKKPYYQEVFFVEYRGVDRGFGVTVPDIFFFGILVYVLAGGLKKPIIWWPYNTFLWIVFIGICALSLVGCPTSYYGLFSLHKFIRGFVFYWVMVNVVRDVGMVRVVVNALTGAVLFQGWLVLFHKYVLHFATSRSLGSFPHPNSLAMYLNCIMPIILSVLLSDLFPRKVARFAMAAIGLGVVGVVFTKSRASLVLMIGAFVLLTMISMAWRPSGHKVKLALAGALASVVAGSVFLPKIIDRFENAPKQSAETRAFFNEAARAMAADKPLGVGLNAYSWMLANSKYYWYVYSDMLDTEDPDGFQESKQGQSRLGTAHHIYYLFAAETGWIGMWAFIALIGRFYWKTFLLWFKTKDVYLKSILLGMLFGMGTIHVQGLLEWIFRQTPIFYLFCVMSGLMVALGGLKSIPAAAGLGRARRVLHAGVKRLTQVPQEMGVS
jgi:O-antigen ligase